MLTMCESLYICGVRNRNRVIKNSNLSLMALFKIFNEVLKDEINDPEGAVMRQNWTYNNTFGEHIN